ncbi:MAG: type IV pilus assembly protein PilM, type IV pilus assembly protein PilM [Microgenomates group bacterium GW2011_GWC1_38_14]|nr:MAG: type IV pilus assembly protein PilM, type IV pilus assembly protein PilM [Microgenomates group bacterium GW2011_GWC1_38_14]
MNKKFFGLDIGATTMKLVALSKDRTGYLLNNAIIAQSPPKGMLSQSPIDEEEMANAIKKAIEDAKIVTKSANIALAENQVYTKVIEMPNLSDRELSSAIYWEAEQQIPVPLSNITLVWNVLKRPEGKNSTEKMQVLMVGAPTLLIKKYQKIIGMAGLTLNALETEIIATVRALTGGPSQAANFPPSIVVNIGAVSTSLAIVRDGIMAFTYSMQIGGSAINRAIATDFGLTAGQAEEYKKVYGISGKNIGDRIGQATRPILESILGEVRKALAFYSQKYSEQKPVRQIVLSGGTAKLPGIDLFFAQNAGLETVIANPWKVLAPQDVPKQIIDNAADYTIAVGLAIREDE